MTGQTPSISRRGTRRGARLLASGLAVAVAATLPIVGLTAAPASAADPLAGSGSAADPYLIGTVADLDAAAAAVNADTAHTGAAVATYQLTGDVDYADGTFDSFTWFGGTLEGDGHTISNLTYRPGATKVGMFQDLVGGVVRDLHLDHVTAHSDNTATNIQVGGFAANADNSTIARSSLTDSTVSMPDNGGNSSALGGLVGKTIGAPTTLRDNYVADVTVSGDKRLGAVVGWPSVATTAENSFVMSTDLATHGNSGSGAAFIYGYGNAVGSSSATGNVVFSGWIAQPGTTADGNIDAYGWVTSGTGYTVDDNLVNANNDIDPADPVGLQTVPDPNPYDLLWTSPGAPLSNTGRWAQGTLGTYTPAPDLTTQATYDALGWDFTDTWAWDSDAKHPVLQQAPIISLDSASITVNQGDVLDQAALVAATGARIDHGTLAADLSGIDTSELGTQTAYLVGTDATHRVTREITVTVQSPAPILTVPTHTISVASGAMPSADLVIELTGATVDSGAIDVDFGALTDADFGSAGASHQVSLTATNEVGTSAPVEVTINVTLPGAGTAADPYQIASVNDLDYVADAVNADTARTGAAVQSYVLTADIDYGGDTFASFTWFGGTFDGAGHAISNLVNPTVAGTQPITSMFQTSTGTIENLVLSHLTSDVTCVGGATNYAAALVNSLAGGTVSGVELVDSSVVMTPGACATSSFVGGLVRTTSGAAVIRDSVVWNTTIGGNKYAAGITAALGAGGTVANNVVNATIYQVTSGSGAAVAGIVEQATGAVTVTGNVLYGGAVTAGTGTTPASGGTHSVGAIGATGTYDATSNLVSSEAQINPSLNGNSVPPIDGTQTPAADLALRGTYEGVGWDFHDGTTPWAWDDTAGHPVLRAAPLLRLAGPTTYTYAVGEESAGSVKPLILEAASPSLEQSAEPSFDVDLSDVEFGKAGTYEALVTGTDGDQSALPRPIVVEIVDPSTLTVAVRNETIDLNAGATLDEATLLARAGAVAADGRLQVTAADLAAVNAAAGAGTLGSYPVRVNASLRGLVGPATTATVRVVAEDAPVITVTTTEQTHVAGDPITADNGAVVLSAAGAVATDGSTPSVEFPAGFDPSTSGTYVVTLTDGPATPVELSVILTEVPAPVVTLAQQSVSYAKGSTPTAATVLTDLGASISHAGSGATMSLDLAGVDFTTPGSYPVTVTGVFRGVAAEPVSATVLVLLPGTGTDADPYLIATAGDLDAAAALVNSDTAHAAAATATFRVTADIDYGGDVFAGFGWFGGTFDGADHTISDITYATTTGAQRTTAMFVTVAGTIENLALSHVESRATCADGRTYYVSGLADTVTGVIRRVALVDSDVVMVHGACATNSFTGGLAHTVGGTVTESMVWNTTVTGNKYAGGISGGGAGTITDNIVKATITQTQGGNGAGVAAVQATATPKEASGNVIYDGSVAGVGTRTTAAIGQVTEPAEPFGADNLVSTDFYIADDGKNQNTAVNGTPASPAELARQDTYEGIGWTFGGGAPWKWIEAGRASHPVLSFLDVDFSPPVVALASPSILVSAQQAVPSNEEILSRFGAVADHGTLTVQLGDPTSDDGTGVNFQLPGAYDVTVTGTDGDQVTVEPATIVVTALAGAGTGADPIQIGSRADLDIMVDNSDDGPGAYESAHYVLTADINYRGDDFRGIDYFTGSFDGAGHTISNLTYVADDSPILAFFRVIDGARVRDLGLNTVSGAGEETVGGLAGKAYASTVTGVSVIAADLTSTGGDAAGLVGSAYANGRSHGPESVSDGSTTTITDNEVLDTAVSAAWVGGGAVGTAKGSVEIARNLVAVDLTDTAVVGPTMETGAGGVLGAVGTNNTGGSTGNTVEVTGNVVLDGGLAYPHGGTRTGYAGQVIGNVAGDPAATADYGAWTESDNRVSDAATLDPGLTGGPLSVGGKGNQDGVAATVEELGAQPTYEGLGWDFDSTWAWEADKSRPTLAAVPELAVPTASLGTTDVVYQLGHVPSDDEILDDLGATLTPSGTLTLERGESDLSDPGTYAVTVIGESNGVGSRAVPATITVIPIGVISTAVSSIEYLRDGSVTPAQFLADTGAALSIAGTVSADLSAVDFGDAGEYTATIEATDDYGFDADPVTVQVTVVDFQPGDGGDPGDPGDGDSTITPGVVTITGTARVGNALSAQPGIWTPAGTPSFQWLRSGVPIAGATGATYTAVPADAGRLIQVRVTETGDAGSVSADSAPVTVEAGRFTGVKPVIVGASTVGATVRANAGTWSPEPTTLAYQWLRDGAPIPAATSSAYVVQPADRGAELSVEVSAVADGYAVTSMTSARVKVAAGSRNLHSAKPRIKGKAEIRRVVRVVTGRWRPTPIFSYQWFVGKRKVRAATDAHFRIPAKARGTKVSVRVRAVLPQYRTVTITAKTRTIR